MGDRASGPRTNALKNPLQNQSRGEVRPKSVRLRGRASEQLDGAWHAQPPLDRAPALPLVVHIEPQTLCVLNKTCRFCPACQLVIARQSEIEPLLQAMVDDEHPVLEQGKYMAIGTLDRGDWRAGQKERWSTVEAINRAWVFKDHWNFVVQNAWGPAHDSSAP